MLANRVTRGAGYKYCHVAVADHSPLPEAAIILPDQRGADAVRAHEQVGGRYLRSGLRIRRVLTDNGRCDRSLDLPDACARMGIWHWRTKPYTPPTDGKAERCINALPERWAAARRYRSSAERAAPLPGSLAEYRHRRSPTLAGRTPLCRFFGVSDRSGQHN